MFIYVITACNPEGYGKYAKKIRRSARKELSWLVLRQKEKCWFCDCRIELGINATVEHLLPIWDGGDNRPNNIVAACSPCNQKRNIEYNAKDRERKRAFARRVLITAIEGFIANIDKFYLKREE